MTLRIICIAAASIFIFACNQPAGTADSVAPAEIAAPTKAYEIAANSIIVDTHIDVPYRLNAKPDDISAATESGDFDYPRAVVGGLNAAIMSIYTPADLEEEGGSKELADKLIDMVNAFTEKWPDKFAIARSPSDVRDQFAAGLISLPLGMENGSPIDGDIANLQYFYDRGIRYITLAHSLSNHISDDAFWQIMDIAVVPAIASHSSARHFTPGFERNMNDEMIVELARHGGVIQINFGSSFITAVAREYAAARSEDSKAYATLHPELSKSEVRTSHAVIYAAEHGPLPFANLSDVLDHIDHIVTITSVDNVGIGSVYDGVGDSLPLGLKDVSTYPNLIDGLLDRGYSEHDIKKILGENTLRIWQAVEDYAATTSSKT